MPVELTEEQVKAVDLCTTRLRSKVPLSTLFGSAGTGKTEVARHIAARLKDEGQVAFCAPTGKAALVLRRRGVPATTVHSLIYRPVGVSQKMLQAALDKLNAARRRATPNGRLIAALEEEVRQLTEQVNSPKFVLREKEEVGDYAAIVLDESSMVGEQMLTDLMSFGIPVLALGDPAQLPPVKATTPLAEAGYRPTVMLNQMHRFAMNSPINRLATAVRTGGPRAINQWLPEGSGVNYVPTFLFDDEQIGRLMAWDQVLVGRNATRLRLNAHIRAVKGLPHDELDDEDVMMCLRNEPRHDLVNGEQATVKELAAAGVPERLIMSVEGWTGEGQKPYFAFGYVTTVHKAQGSEWPRVAIFDESNVFGRDAGKWLYTGITRAAEAVCVVRCT